MIKKISDMSNAPSPAEKKEEIIYLPPSDQPRFADRLARNVALAGMLILAVTAVRNAKLPTGQTVLTYVQAMIEDNWDESIGKISFVSNLLPETVAVFFDTSAAPALTVPCLGASLTHAWSEGEPYLGYTAEDQRVYAALEGQVMSVAHGPGEEKILRIRHDNGLETLYYNLASLRVEEGEQVTKDTCLGEKLPASQAVVEVRRAGRAIDPTALFSPRGEKTP